SPGRDQLQAGRLALRRWPGAQAARGAVASKVALAGGGDERMRSSQPQQLARVVAEDLGGHVGRQVDLGEQLELRHVLPRVKKIRAEHEPVGAADEELAA